MIQEYKKIKDQNSRLTQQLSNRDLSKEMTSRQPQFFIAIKGGRSKTEGNGGTSKEAPNDNWIGETSGHHRYCTKDLLENPVEMMLGRCGETGYKSKGNLRAATRFPRFYDKLDTDRRKQAQ